MTSPLIPTPLPNNCSVMVFEGTSLDPAIYHDRITTAEACARWPRLAPIIGAADFVHLELRILHSPGDEIPIHAGYRISQPVTVLYRFRRLDTGA